MFFRRVELETNGNNVLKKGVMELLAMSKTIVQFIGVNLTLSSEVAKSAMLMAARYSGCNNVFDSAHCPVGRSKRPHYGGNSARLDLYLQSVY